MLDAKSRHSARRGKALGEIISFLAVFLVGLAIGIYFLGGFDVDAAAESVRQWGEKAGLPVQSAQATVVSEDDDANETSPAQPLQSHSIDDDREPTHDSGVERLRTQLVQLAQRAVEIAGIRTPEAPPAGDDTARRETADATLRFWNQVNAVLAAEAAMRTAPVDVTEANATGFVTARTRASHFAAGELRNLDRNGVDCRVLELTNEIIAWYDQAVQLNREAAYLLEHADEATRRGPRGEQWKHGEQAHYRRCLEINQRGEALRQEMNQTYGLDFPPLQ